RTSTKPRPWYGLRPPFVDRRVRTTSLPARMPPIVPALLWLATQGSCQASSEPWESADHASGELSGAHSSSVPAPEGPQRASAPAGPHAHCTGEEAPDPRDAMLSGEPETWIGSNGDIDLVLPAAVRAWMTERKWQASHDAWHNI